MDQDPVLYTNIYSQLYLHVVMFAVGKWPVVSIYYNCVNPARGNAGIGKLFWHNDIILCTYTIHVYCLLADVWLIMATIVIICTSISTDSPPP